MSGRKARAERKAVGVTKVAKVGTPLNERAVPVIRDGQHLPHPSGRVLRAMFKRSEVTGEQLGSKTPGTKPDTTGRKG